jgi:hypothetical protein
MKAMVRRGLVTGPPAGAGHYDGRPSSAAATPSPAAAARPPTAAGAASPAAADRPAGAPSTTPGKPPRQIKPVPMAAGAAAAAAAAAGAAAGAASDPFQVGGRTTTGSQMPDHNASNGQAVCSFIPIVCFAASLKIEHMCLFV